MECAHLLGSGSRQEGGVDADVCQGWAAAMQEACAGDASSQLLQAGLDGCSTALPQGRLQAALIPLRPVLHQSCSARISGHEVLPTCTASTHLKP